MTIDRNICQDKEKRESIDLNDKKYKDNIKGIKLDSNSPIGKEDK